MTEATARQSTMSQGEWEVRKDLAAAYRLVALYGWEDLVLTHLSARVPGPEHHFLINPYGWLFDEITASSLVKVDQDGEIVEGGATNRVNPAGFTIHSAVHMSSDDMNAVLHTHTRAGNAVACMKDGLLPYHQKALTILGFVGYHDYESVALDHDERERIVKSLGGGRILVLRNHGLLTVGETIGEAFFWMYRMEAACQYQVDMLSLGQELQPPSQEVQDYTIDIGKKIFGKGGSASKNMQWPAMIRKLERETIDDWRQ
ncbi:MAG TPA: class II aldolase [Alcanivorax sp.]|nr:class II aldolase [Alcanivorax sp.]